MKVRRHMEAEYGCRKVRASEELKYNWLRRLSPMLRTELYNCLNASMLRRHPFFRELSRSAMQALCEMAESALFNTGAVVCRRGQLADSMFFVVTGELDIDTENLTAKLGLSQNDENEVDIVSFLVLPPFDVEDH